MPVSPHLFIEEKEWKRAVKITDKIETCMHVSVCVWRLNERSVSPSPSVCSFPLRVHRSTSWGAIFQRGPPVTAVAAVNMDSGAWSRVWRAGGHRVLCKTCCYRHHHAWLLIGDTLYTRCEAKQLFPLFYPPEMPSACRWWTMLLLCWENQRRAPHCKAAWVYVLMFVYAYVHMLSYAAWSILVGSSFSITCSRCSHSAI